MNVESLIYLAVVTCIALPLGMSLFRYMGWMDNPVKYGHARAPVPYSFGVLIFVLYFAYIFCTTSMFDWKVFQMFALASTLLVLTAWIDDRITLSPFFRLGVQCIAAILIVASGVAIPEMRTGIDSVVSLQGWSFAFFGYTIEPFTDFLVIIWLVACINVMNWLDGITGLATGSGAVAATMLTALAWSYGQGDMAEIMFPLAVICMIFVVFELDPPKFLIGDSGSMFIGFALGVFTCIAGGKVATLVLVGCVPFIDAAFTIARRIYMKTSPFSGDVFHFHHLLLRAGYSRRAIVVGYMAVSSCLGLFSLMLESVGKILLLLLVCAVQVSVQVRLFSRYHEA